MFTGIDNPDILIRTGGKRRLSNFLLWQLAYSELYFVDKLWPDFKTKDFHKIISHFKRGQKELWKGMSNLNKRILTSIIVLPFSFFFILKGGNYIVSFLYAILILGNYEVFLSL